MFLLYSLILAINIILVLAGLYFLFHTAIFTLLLKGTKEHFIVVPAREKDENLFDKIYRAHIQVNMLCFSGNMPVYVVDFDLSDETKSKLKGYFSCCGEIIFIDKDSTAEFLTDTK